MGMDIDEAKYIVSCRNCKNKECVKGTEKCKAEQWKKKALKRRSKMKTFAEAKEELECFATLSSRLLDGIEYNDQIPGEESAYEALKSLIDMVKLLERKYVLDYLWDEIKKLKNEEHWGMSPEQEEYYNMGLDEAVGLLIECGAWSSK